MIDKTLKSCLEAVAPVFNGAIVMMAGFGGTGNPSHLAEALRQQGATDLTVIHNGGGDDDHGLGGLILDGRVRKLIASFPNSPRAWAFRDRYLKGEIELELLPQGSLVERIRAAGVGLGGIYTPSSVGTDLAAGKETREIDGRQYIFEKPLRADFAFIKAHRGDRLGNLSYRFVMRNFNMIMATAGKIVLAEVDQIVPVGAISPEEVHTPGIYVDRVIQVERLPKTARRQKEGKAA